MKKAACALATAIIMSAMLLVCAAAFANTASAAVRYGDSATASDGMVLVGVDGEFSTSQRSAALALINKYRKEACEQGVKNPSTGEPLTPSDYKPIKWSSDLEYIAQTRSAEACVVMDHTRPNGESCFTASHNGVSSHGEVIAWNGGSMTMACQQWYSEKSIWVNGTSGVTGHYTQMINPNNTYIGLGTFIPSSGGFSATAGEFSSRTGLDEQMNGASGAWTQAFEIQASAISGFGIAGKATVGSGERATYYTTLSFGVVDYWGSSSKATVKNLGAVTWSCTGNATVSSSGKLTAGKLGKATLKATCGTYSATKTITIGKGSQTIKIKKALVTYKASKLKKSAKTFRIGASAKGKITYSVSKSVKKKGVSVSAKGKVTVKKRTKKGTYKITVKAAATSSCKAATKTVKVVVK